MIRRHVHAFSNIEFDWLACDADGFVALFSSAGFGPVPEELPAMVDAVDAVLDRMKALPAIGEASAREATTDTWETAAERGFFAFDWAHAHDRYEIEALPRRPLRKVAAGTYAACKHRARHARPEHRAFADTRPSNSDNAVRLPQISATATVLPTAAQRGFLAFDWAHGHDR